jgi:hypothetical protein
MDSATEGWCVNLMTVSKTRNRTAKPEMTRPTVTREMLSFVRPVEIARVLIVVPPGR